MNPHYLSALLLAAGLAAAAAAAEQPLVIDPAQSRIEVAVKATVDSFVGRLVAYEPEIVVADDGTITRARLAFHFRDVQTGKERRDEAMHKWQQTETHPDGLFVLSSLGSGTTATAMARGRLSLHGVTRDLEFPVSINRDGSRYAIDGDVPVDTREFGLPAVRMLALLKVNPVVHVRFHLQGTSSSAMVSTGGRR
jgi:polyisoprenoid-binding protein YceI